MTNRRVLTKTQSLVEDKSSETSSPRHPVKKRAPSWSDIWLYDTSSLRHAVFAKQFQQSLAKVAPTPTSKDPDKEKTLTSDFSGIDRILLLSDNILLRILSKLPVSQRNSNSLVCKRWLNLQGRLVRSLKVFDWDFLESGRLNSRFPNLSNVDLINGCFVRRRDAGVLLSRRLVSLHIDSWASKFFDDDMLLPVEIIDRGLKVLASGCPNLRRLVVIGASEMGLLSLGEECLILQELELHKCSDNVLRGIAACENLQILKLVGSDEGFYSSLVSDIGLTILAQGCKRLVKLELSGCAGSFEGIKTIGQCCQMLEELTFCDHRMEGEWLSALSYCENLKTLRFVSCKRIDLNPGPDEYLGSCPALERLHLQKCQLRDKKSVRALFWVCAAVRELVIQDCWGLNNDVFKFASVFRRVESLSLEGCSLVTTEGLESAILSWAELQSLRVVSCKSIKDGEVSPALSTLFSVLKELKWRPDTKSLLASSTEGISIGKRGGKFFKKTLRLK